MIYKDGIAAVWLRMSREIKKTRKWSQPYTIELADVADMSTEHDRKERVPARTLTVDSLTVRYGTVVAVNDVSFRLEPGRVTGLIGPNGAGKTSLIDAVSGFTPSQGKVLLDDVDLSKRPAMRVPAPASPGRSSRSSCSRTRRCSRTSASPPIPRTCARTSST